MHMESATSKQTVSSHDRSAGSGYCGLLAAVLFLCQPVLGANTQESTTRSSFDFFENQIRPQLVEQCYPCHSSKADKIGGGLRLDTRSGVLAGGDSGPVLVPGDPDRSLLIRALRHESRDLAMPRSKAGARRLPDRTIENFIHWIQLGAPYPPADPASLSDSPGGETHWAFRPIRNPPAPEVQTREWPRTPIDRFILACLESRGQLPSPPADRRTLLRRACFDLTGLPPSPELIETFLADQSPQAFERVVENLLDSPGYGERWGRHWLDVVRYADTAGDTADYPVPVAWRYRNYVIDAFNHDKPYDEFLREQIAGDILAKQGPATQYAERVTATGYLAISRRFGFDSENYHHLTIQDTIDTLGQSVLGLSLGCARCHNHKFDPVSAEEYYGLYGIFDSTRYAFPGSEQKTRVRALAPLDPNPELKLRWTHLEARFAALNLKPGAVLRSLEELDGDFEIQHVASGGSNGVLVPPWIYDGPLAVTTEAQSPFKNLHLFGIVGVSAPAGTNTYRMAQRIPRSHTGHTTHVNLDFRVSTNTPDSRAHHRFWLGAPPASPTVEILIASDSIWMKTGEQTNLIRSLSPGHWHNLQLTLDEENKTVSAKVAASNDSPRECRQSLPSHLDSPLQFLVLEGGKTQSESLPGLDIDNIGVQQEPLTPATTTVPPALVEGLPHTHLPQLKEELKQLESLRSEATAPGDSTAAASVPGSDEKPPAEANSLDSKISALQATIQRVTAEEDQAKQNLNAQLAAGPVDLAYGVTEGTPHNVRLQVRGEPDNPGPEVPRGLLKVLGGGPLPSGATGSGRLELARSLTSPRNPLTARVMANRIWQYHFGRGLVKTPNDFGKRGQEPTHPDLLDYLATQFIQSGWSIKSLHRLILRSATYQQASFAEPDTGNPVQPPTPDLYGSFERRRLTAEELRDSILQVSGGLDRSPGGGHPFPPATSWSYSQHVPFSAVYEHSKRSVYLMTQRIERHPFLALFDGADPNTSTPDRRTTTVPTQALFFLNSKFVHTETERFAKRLLESCTAPDRRIELAYRLALARPPNDQEQTEAIAFLNAYRSELTSAGVEQPESTALAAFARVLIGSNEFLSID